MNKKYVNNKENEKKKTNSLCFLIYFKFLALMKNYFLVDDRKSVINISTKSVYVEPGSPKIYQLELRSIFY